MDTPNNKVSNNDSGATVNFPGVALVEKLKKIDNDCSILGFVRLPTLVQLLGVSKTTIYKEIRAGRFPKQVRLSPRVSAWRIIDLQTYFDKLNSRPAE